ncbi:hypothetical protein GCM10023208_17250 [Erythrobacter westpacificensis]|uniref:Uncharacterized protein n=1 Tax=Erythrobacter westpacificensis TaxID=1055231 RepID=A0ABP9KA38_9SPHN
MPHKFVVSVLAAPALLLSGACSESTESNAEAMAERAAADAEANAEVIGNELREGAIVAADELSEGAAELSNDLAEADTRDTAPGDGELDGTD